MPFLISILLLMTIVTSIAWYSTYARRKPHPRKKRRFKFFFKKLKPEQVKILLQYSRYYRMLPENEKAFYENRVSRFIDQKKFIPKGDLQLTDEMKLLIADSAVKLTFGLKYYQFGKFPEFVIFKSKFYSEWSHSKEVGETNPRGVIVFSWKDLQEGDLIENDNQNLGLHEFAHALMEQTVGTGHFEDNHFLSWASLFFEYYEKPENIENIRNQKLFRKYAFTNEMEFFAIAVEHFFETPVRFRKNIPELYDILGKMLNQDTATYFPEEQKTETIPSGNNGRVDSSYIEDPEMPHQA